MKRLILGSCIMLLAFAANADDTSDVGSVNFPTSGSPEAQQHFLRGVATLHSFGFKQARTAFQEAQAADPVFAMAYWGESLTYNHPLITEWDLETPRAVLSKLGSTSEERIAAAPTDREQGFITAVDALFFGEGDTMAHIIYHHPPGT